MRAGKIPTAAINTHSCALDELPEALPAGCTTARGVVKAMVRMPDVAAA
jgi:hypothetical protein